jgi:hypothetical protein
VLGRLRLSLWLLLAAAVGYLLGGGPFADWVEDVYHMVELAWRDERLSRGSNGALPLLVAGYLIGQGIYLAIRQYIRRIGPAKVRKAERTAAWDPSLRIGTRFGLHRYLEQCVRWAAEDPTARTQSLALFKLRGLGELNEKCGTYPTTQLLQRMATDLRMAAVPDSISKIRRFFARYFPRPIEPQLSGMAAARYPARWSGGTFALAFRELDAVQAVGMAREVATWIAGELNELSTASKPRLSAAIAIGIPNVTARGLTKAAVEALNKPTDSAIVVVHDPADVRADIVAQMTDVDRISNTMDRREPEIGTELPGSGVREQFMLWLRSWGPSVGCMVGALLWLQVTGGKVVASARTHAWPDSLTEVQVVTSSGARTVHLVRQNLVAQRSAGWSAEGLIVQGNPTEGQFTFFEIHVTVTNQTKHPYFVSVHDFLALDAEGRSFQFNPDRMLRFEDGMTGQWLRPGESLSGWLAAHRDKSPISKLVFEPTRNSRLVLETSVP